MINVPVYFNNFDLSTLPGVKVVNYVVTNLPSRTLNASKLARSNRSVLTSAEYTNKDISVETFVGGSTPEIAQDNLDRLKAYVQDVEGILRVKQGTKTVEYVGTLNGLSIEYIGTGLKVTLTFSCSDPIGKEYTTMNLFSPLAITTSTYSQALTVEGSFQAEPRLQIKLNTVTTGGTSKTISILNAATGKGIKITRNWVAGDLLSIASDAMEVTVNAQPVDFSGQFPTFMPGARTIQYIDDFTARNVTLTGTYNRKYS